MTDAAANDGRPPVRESGAGERIAEDMVAAVRQELQAVRGEWAETARRAGAGGLLLAVSGCCALLAVGAASTTALRMLEAVLPRRMAAAALTAGYLGAAVGLGRAGIQRLQAAEDRSEHLGDEAKHVVADTVGRLAEAGGSAVRQAGRR